MDLIMQRNNYYLVDSFRRQFYVFDDMAGGIYDMKDLMENYSKILDLLRNGFFLVKNIFNPSMSDTIIYEDIDGAGLLTRIRREMIATKIIVEPDMKKYY